MEIRENTGRSDEDAALMIHELPLTADITNLWRRNDTSLELEYLQALS